MYKFFLNTVKLQKLDLKLVDGYKTCIGSRLVFASISFIKVSINCNNTIDYLIKKAIIKTIISLNNKIKKDINLFLEIQKIDNKKIVFLVI